MLRWHMLISKLNYNVLGWLINEESIVLQSQATYRSVGYKTNQFPIIDVFGDHDSKFTIQLVLSILKEVPKIIDSGRKVNSLYGSIATKLILIW